MATSSRIKSYLWNSRTFTRWFLRWPSCPRTSLPAWGTWRPRWSRKAGRSRRSLFCRSASSFRPRRRSRTSCRCRRRRRRCSAPTSTPRRPFSVSGRCRPRRWSRTAESGIKMSVFYALIAINDELRDVFLVELVDHLPRIDIRQLIIQQTLV